MANKIDNSQNSRPLFLVLDIETTGLAEPIDLDIDDIRPIDWPRCVQIAWSLYDNKGECLNYKDYIIQIDGFNIPHSAYMVHGISDRLAKKEGVPIQKALSELDTYLIKSDYVVGHNVEFDVGGIAAEYIRLGKAHPFKQSQFINTCSEQTKQLCKIEGGRGRGYKYPKLGELHYFLFNEEITDSHNATRDVVATARCFFELLRTKRFSIDLTAELLELLSVNPISLLPQQENSTEEALGLMASKIEDHFGGQVENHQRQHQNLREKSKALESDVSSSEPTNKPLNIDLDKINFVHLHVHSHYTLLGATSKFSELVEIASKDSMLGIACTDMGYMTGIFDFLKTVKKHNEKQSNQKNHLKPIIGCELNVCRNHLDKSKKDNGYQIVFLAKNLNGYRNLLKLVSISRTKGFYYVPRVDRELVLTYKEDLIVLSGSSEGELYSKILNKGDHFAIDALRWWKEHFKNDFYIEINRQGEQEEQKVTNRTLIDLSRNFDVSLVACNNTFYSQKEDKKLHDILLCIGQGSVLSASVGRGRGMRFSYPNEEYYFKSQKEMKSLFADIPQAIASTEEIYNKIDFYEISRDVELPKFQFPTNLNSKDKNDDSTELANQHLRQITYEGAKELYPELTKEVTERIDYELEVIRNTGYPGYFLILSDLVKQAYHKGVDVGPGRGSAAGSIVAYCVGITKVDPLKYNLLFERFLNPDRVSLPDIDIDFEDSGRSKVIQYLVDLYGKQQVSQILTFSTLKPKNAILDVGRVLELSIVETRQLSDKVNSTSNSLNEILTEKISVLKKMMSATEFKNAEMLREIYKGDDKRAETLRYACRLEGTNRNLSTHACGVIIAPKEITNYVPITKIKDSELTATQYDNYHVEDAGLLKMDILGLTTLTTIKETIRKIRNGGSERTDLENPPLDDDKTFHLFQNALTDGVFQYESSGMKRCLKELKPTSIEDLVAVNALFRPGPMEYIPSYIARKHGKEKIEYDIPETEEILKETFGITVYQEQVMLLSQKLAGFSKGEADLLRKAMGKKEKIIIDKLKPKFIEGGKTRGFSTEKLAKIWSDWESFARYAFNKSHSVSYALLGYKTAFLKAHHPAEYMAAVMSQNMNKPEKLTNYLIECQKLKVKVLGPDINESNRDFAVTGKNVIRFGFGGIKFLSSHSIDHILEIRTKGQFESIFDLMERINTKICNKKSLSALIRSGSLDSFNSLHRTQYFEETENQMELIDQLMVYSDKHSSDSANRKFSLFDLDEIDVIKPQIPSFKPSARTDTLLIEKKYIGFYLSAHPLDDFYYEIKEFVNYSVFDFSTKRNQLVGAKQFSLGGIITNVNHRQSKSGNPYASFMLEDKTSSSRFLIFGEQYKRFVEFIEDGKFVCMTIQLKSQHSNSSNLDEPRVNYIEFENLKGLFEKRLKHLKIPLYLNDLDNNKVDSIVSVFKNRTGTSLIHFEIEDKELKNSNSPVQLTKNSNVDSSLLKELETQNINFYLVLKH